MTRLKEQKSWDQLKKATDNLAELDLIRVENQFFDGMADIYFFNNRGASGWLESKALAALPKRESTRPLAHVFEPGQVPFLKRITFMGGRAYVILRVEETPNLWFLLRPNNPIELIDMTTDDIRALSVERGLHNIVSYLMGLDR